MIKISSLFFQARSRLSEKRKIIRFGSVEPKLGGLLDLPLFTETALSNITESRSDEPNRSRISRRIEWHNSHGPTPPGKRATAFLRLKNLQTALTSVLSTAEPWHKFGYALGLSSGLNQT